MEGSLFATLPRCDLHTGYGNGDVRHRQTPSTNDHVSCSGSYGEEWMASSELASQPVLQVFHLQNKKSMRWSPAPLIWAEFRFRGCVNKGVCKQVSVV